MAASLPKITLSSARDIPFNKLVLSQANVRRIKSGLSIEELAADIARRGLLQSLYVRPVLDADGAETGQFEIPAGGRRFRALELLVKQKRLAKTAPVPCVVRGATDILAEDDSLAENVQRVALHPLDQFRAFQTLREKGQSEEAIAAAFFVPVAVVRQRLRLASVSERLLAVYAEDGMTLEQLMAFTVSADHKRQERVWEAIQKSWSKEPYHIRRMLTEKAVQASDRRARFVGTEAYEAAGGGVLRDLFQDDGGGWLQDPALLDRLATEKLKAAAATIAAEGWKWLDVALELPYGHVQGLRELEGMLVALTDAEEASLATLEAEYAKLEQEYAGADELPDAVDARLGEIEMAIARLNDRPIRYSPANIARAGAFVSIAADGSLSVERGYVRPEDDVVEEDEGNEHGREGDDESEVVVDRDPIEAGVRRTIITVGGDAAAEEAEDETLRPLPDRLVMELTAHRTLALRDAVAKHPHVALTALLHKLVTDSFGHASRGGCLDVRVDKVMFPVQAPGLKDSPSAKAIADRHAAWQADLPLADDQALWDWLAALDDPSRLALLAHCVSSGVNALYERADGSGRIAAHGVQQRLHQADRLARAAGLDMVEAGWRPTIDTYLSRVPKLRILEAVREAKGEPAVQLIDHLKKADMAREAERLLDGSGWLPDPLRLIDDGEPVEREVDGDDAAEALPDFLSGDADDGPAIDGDRLAVNAAA